MWYYANNGAQSGPLQEPEISPLIANGTLTAASLVWRDGMAEWLPLGQSELARLLAPVSMLAGTTNPYQPPQVQTVYSVEGVQEEGAPLTWSQIFWSFSGRIPRRTYWAASLIWFGIFLGLALIGGLVGAAAGNENMAAFFVVIGLIPSIWSSTAIQVKRWHDRGKSGAMVLINFIPYVGGIWTFIECGCLRGTEGRNRHGSDPT
jgi:uncharacterized membrane protein YhaH (DUF805 family)